MAGSKYVENKAFLSRRSGGQPPALREMHERRANRCGTEEQWLGLVPFLHQKCGIEIWGRVLEIGAGGGWLSAEISKLPRVVEVVTTDYWPELLKERSPAIFEKLKANTAKITRMPADYHQLDFPENYFDFVVSSAVLHDAGNIVQVLREAKRVLKPGGQFLALREPVWPLVKIKSRARILEKLVKTGVNERFYTLSQYKEFFRQASLPLTVKRINLASGWKFYFDQLVNGFTHARYAFIGTKRGTAKPPTVEIRSARSSRRTRG